MSRTNVQVKILKYESIIKKHPHKVLGYYSLGRIYLDEKEYTVAEQYLHNALHIDKKCISVIADLIIVYLYKNKFRKCIRLYIKNEKILTSNTLVNKRLLRKVSEILNERHLKIHHSNSIIDFINMLIVKNKMNNIDNLSKQSSDFIIILYTGLFLTLGNKIDILNCKYFLECIQNSKVSDNFKWFLLERLMHYDDRQFNIKNMSCYFTIIPAGSSIDLANRIFKKGIRANKINNIKKLYKSAIINDIPLTDNNLWHYIYLCNRLSINDIGVFNSCLRLVENGWINSHIINTIKKYKKNLHIKVPIRIKRILDLYSVSL